MEYKMKLNVGGQQSIDRFPEGWTCIDIMSGADIHHNLRKGPMPIKDATVDALYCSHVIEHLFDWYISFVLSDFHRVLKPGQPIRIVVPDMDLAIDQYIADGRTGESLQCYMRWWFDPTRTSQGKVYLNHVTGFNFNH